MMVPDPNYIYVISEPNLFGVLSVRIDLENWEAPDQQKLHYGWIGQEKEGPSKIWLYARTPSEDCLETNSLGRQLAGKILSDSEDYVVCRICDVRRKNLSLHLIKVHKISCSEYLQMFPGERITSKAWQRKREETWMRKLGVRNLSFSKEVVDKILASQKETNLARYGVENVFQADRFKTKIFANRKQKWIEKYGVSHPNLVPEVKEKTDEKRKDTCIKRYGYVSVLADPHRIKEFKEKRIKTNLKRYGVCNTYFLAKDLPNRLERLFDKLTPTFIKYTGDGTFFIRFKDGKVKNPDFVVRPFRKWRAVIEIFGEYYHRPEEEKELIERYKEVGVNCLVVWEREIGQEDKRRKALIKKINGFLDRISSETIRQTPSKNEGDNIVQPTF